MKNLFLILIAVLGMAISTFAQDKAVVFKTDEFFFDPTYTSADSVTNLDTLYSTQVTLNKPCPIKYDIQVGIDKYSGTPKGLIKLQGKKFKDDAWTTITTINYVGSADTTINFTQVSTAQYYRYVRVYHDAKGSAVGKYKILATRFKFWDK